MPYTFIKRFKTSISQKWLYWLISQVFFLSFFFRSIANFSVVELDKVPRHITRSGFGKKRTKEYDNANIKWQLLSIFLNHLSLIIKQLYHSLHRYNQWQFTRHVNKDPVGIFIFLIFPFIIFCTHSTRITFIQPKIFDNAILLKDLNKKISINSNYTFDSNKFFNDLGKSTTYSICKQM